MKLQKSYIYLQCRSCNGTYLQRVDGWIMTDIQYHAFGLHKNQGEKHYTVTYIPLGCSVTNLYNSDNLKTLKSAAAEIKAHGIDFLSKIPQKELNDMYCKFSDKLCFDAEYREKYAY